MTPHPPEILIGDSVRLRRSSPGDAAAVYAAARDPEVMRFMDWPAHRDVGEARDFLDGVAGRWESGEEYHWVIEDEGGGDVLGCIACRVVDDAADFGYFLARAAWGRGAMTRAVALLLAWLETQPGVRRISATTDAENERSGQVLERAGLRREAVLPRSTVRPNIGGGPRDTVVYSLPR